MLSDASTSYHCNKRNNSTRELSGYMAAFRKNQPEHEPENGVQQKLCSEHTVMCITLNFDGPSYERVQTYLVNGTGSERPTCVRALELNQVISQSVKLQGFPSCQVPVCYRCRMTIAAHTEKRSANNRTLICIYESLDTSTTRVR